MALISSTRKFITTDQLWLKGLLLSAASVYLYVFMEWIFFVTKPSFMSNLNTSQSVQIFFLTSFILTIPALVASLLLYGISRFLNIRVRADLSWLMMLVPATIYASLALILIDNFTYTVLGFGVVSTQGIWRGIYALLYLGLLAGCILYFRKYTHAARRIDRFTMYSIGTLFFLSAILFVLQASRLSHNNPLIARQSSGELPNIILLGADGVNAENMSVYGYERDTTPNISAWAQNALMAENAFSNSGNTGGSLTAILTGKLPTDTRVVYPPDILMGEDAYQHLPGILRQMGYRTVQVTMPSFGDAYERNLRDGFDVANFKSEDTFPLTRIFERLGGGNGSYFSGLILQRITDRLGHAFFLKKMENPFEIVTEPTPAISEKERFNAMLAYLDESEKPLFLHVHMMTTHGPKFAPRKNVFSKGQNQSQAWMLDFYDDAILDFDSYVNTLFKHLTKTGKIDNTLVILYSDHGKGWESRSRVPLIIWFPKKAHTGRIQQNVQLIDIAPTILDYLGMAQPDWMSGQSLLANDFSSSRVIFSAETSGDLVENIAGKGWVVDSAKVSPPFYQLAAINSIVCNQWFSLNLRSPELTYGNVDGSTALCNEEKLLSVEEAKEVLLKRLQQDGYDISSFPPDIPVRNPDSASSEPGGNH